MPGYDRDLFVELDETLAEEYTCGICHDIYKSPVVLSCCGQTYCQDCIEEWLENHRTCPNDRRPINRNNLQPAARMVLNLLNKLRIKCDYHAQGCAHVCPLENLNTHLRDQCEFNPDRKCKDCGAIKNQTDDHNCIKVLFEQVTQLRAEINSLSEQLAIRRDTEQIEAYTSTLALDQIRELRRDFAEDKEYFRTSIDSLAESLYMLMSDIVTMKEKMGIDD